MQILNSVNTIIKDEFEDTKGTIRSRKSKNDDNTMTKAKMTNGQTMVNKTLHIKLKIEYHKQQQ